VDVQPLATANDYVMVRNKLTTMNRWRQMLSPSVAVPKSSESPIEVRKKSNEKETTKQVAVCEIDYVRPAVKKIAVKRDAGEENMAVSASVYQRRDYGKENKKKYWYEQQVKRCGQSMKLPQFVGEFKELATGAQKDYGNLNQKMAVIYIDGNNFGKKLRAFCTNEQKQNEFDQKLRIKYQCGALRTLLEDIKDDQHWKNNNKIRLETLLWGGDEIIWVAPAWKGWWTLGRFYQIAKDWKLNENNLSHAAGLVFCHHNAPIHRIKNLAKDLAEIAKRKSRDYNLVAYEVLESFDHAGSDLEAYRKMRCPSPIDPDSLLLKGDHMLELENGYQFIDIVQKLKDLLPRRKVHNIVQSLYEGDMGKVDRLQTGIEAGVVEGLNRLKSCLGDSHTPWLHLQALWDYVGQTNNENDDHDAD
jgi:hypothetical protein